MKAQYILPLAAISAVSTVVSPARATQSYYVYLYVSGTPVDVTTSATVNNGHVFLNGNWIGTLNIYNHIIDAENEVIGYVLSDDMHKAKLTFSKWWK